MCRGFASRKYLRTYNRPAPGDPDNSYLVHKIEGVASISGQRMPLGGPFLTQSDIDLVRAWIAQGALNNSRSAEARQASDLPMRSRCAARGIMREHGASAAQASNVYTDRRCAKCSTTACTSCARRPTRRFRSATS